MYRIGLHYMSALKRMKIWRCDHRKWQRIPITNRSDCTKWFPNWGPNKRKLKFLRIAFSWSWKKRRKYVVYYYYLSLHACSTKYYITILKFTENNDNLFFNETYFQPRGSIRTYFKQDLFSTYPVLYSRIHY